ncbi:MAG: prepilin-type N-terminal cleavage/methylation domain-containing protein [Nitrospiria bacterium]
MTYIVHRVDIKREQGFTLLEIMISLGILSVIFTLVYGTFTAVYQGTEHMEEEADIYRLARLGIYHISNNLSMIYTGVAGASSGASESLVFTGEDRDHSDGDETFPNDSIQFRTVSHWRSLPDAAESDRTTIGYSLVDGTLIQESTLEDGEVLKQEIGGPVQGLNFRYMEENGKSWIDEWGTEKGKNPPLAVEIELFLKKKGRRVRRFKTWVDIPMSRRS